MVIILVEQVEEQVLVLVQEQGQHLQGCGHQAQPFPSHTMSTLVDTGKPGKVGETVLTFSPRLPSPPLPHRVRETPAHHPPEKVTLAFGSLTQPVLVEKMASDDVRIVQNALAAVVRLFTVPLNLVQSIKAGGVGQLTTLTKHPDVVVRRRAARALELLMNNASGKAVSSVCVSVRVCVGWCLHAHLACMFGLRRLL